MLAQNIKKARTDKHLSQRALADIIGVSQQTVGSWEVGRTSPDNEMLKKLAAFFNVSVDYLLGCTDEPGGTAEKATTSSQNRPLYDTGPKVMRGLIHIEDSLKKLAVKKSIEIRKLYVDIANRLYDIEYELFRAEDKYHSRKIMEKEQKILFSLKVRELMKENDISEADASEIVAETQKNQHELAIRQAFNDTRTTILSQIGILVDIQDMEKSMASSTISAINNFKRQIREFTGFKNNAFHASPPSIEDLKILDTVFFRKLYEEQKNDNQHRILPEMFWLPDFNKNLQSAARRYVSDPQLSIGTAKSICSNTFKDIKQYNHSQK